MFLVPRSFATLSKIDAYVTSQLHQFKSAHHYKIIRVLRTTVLSGLWVEMLLLAKRAHLFLPLLLLVVVITCIVSNSVGRIRRSSYISWLAISCRRWCFQLAQLTTPVRICTKQVQRSFAAGAFPIRATTCRSVVSTHDANLYVYGMRNWRGVPGGGGGVGQAVSAAARGQKHFLCKNNPSIKS